MGNLSNFVKRVRDIMRNDAGINGDAQRIEQIAWMLFLKVYDSKEQDWFIDDTGSGTKKIISRLFLNPAAGVAGRTMKMVRA